MNRFLAMFSIRAFVEIDNDLRAVGDAAGDQRAVDAGLELAPEEPLERARAVKRVEALADR